MSHHEEQEEERQQPGSGLAWFLMGAAIGAIGAILYAPKSGRETRKLISDTTQRGRDAVSGTSREVYERGKDVYDRSRQVVDDAASLFERGRKLVRG
jgi:gas vesicle protein